MMAMEESSYVYLELKFRILVFVYREQTTA